MALILLDSGLIGSAIGKINSRKPERYLRIRAFRCNLQALPVGGVGQGDVEDSVEMRKGDQLTPPPMRGECAGGLIAAEGRNSGEECPKDRAG